jgi:hypothetical protein
MDDRSLLHLQFDAPMLHLKHSYIFAMFLSALPEHCAFHCFRVPLIMTT